MSKIVRSKCTFAFGFVLLFIMLLPCGITAKAANVEGTSKDIQLNVTSKALVVDTTYDLKVYNLSNDYKVLFKSDSSSVASVNHQGTVTGKKVGTATITVTIKDGFKTVATLDCDITVGPPAISIKLTKSQYTLLIGDRTSLKGILKPDNTVEEPRFVSTDPGIASVNSTGKVTAKAVGEVYIYAFLNNEEKDFCKIVVSEPAKSTNSDKK